MALGFYYGMMVLAGFVFSGMVFSAKLFEMAGVSFIELSVIPSIFAVIGLGIFLRKRIFDVSALGRKWLFYYFLSGILMVVGMYAPLFLGVSVGMTLLLTYAQPIWTLLISHFILKRKVKSFELLVFFLIIFGVYILLGVNKIEGSVLGIILALLAGLGISFEVFCVEKLSTNKISANVTYFWYFLTSLVFFIILGFFFKDINPKMFSLELFNFDRLDIWFYLMIYTFFTCWVGNIAMYKGFEKVPALHGGLILFIEPVGGVILDTTIIGTSLTWNMVIGGLMILTGNGVLIWKSAKGPKDHHPVEKPVFEEL